MSLQKSAMQARLAKLPMLPPMPPPSNAPTNEDEEEDNEEDETDGLGELPSLAIAGSGGTAASGTSSSTSSTTSSVPPPRRRTSKTSNMDLSPLSASTHFDQAVQVAVPDADLDVRVYITAPVPTDDSTGSIMVFHHGAGYSALSFAVLAKEITQSTGGECGVLAFDARAHGKTTSLSNPGFDPPELDLTIDRLTQDTVDLLTTVFPNTETAPALILVGHSMGGAVLTRASGTLIEKGYHVGGIAVLDVVEGSAMDALPIMHHLLESRPEGFPTQERAVEWHVTGQTGSTIQNVYSARLSVPSLVVPSTPEEVEAGKPAWKWRTPLKSTAPFWEGWFRGLSQAFLTARTARLLILAGTDRLDQTLMIGQMQGKFQLDVVPNVGHMLHEDDPVRIAETLVRFWKRNERLILPNVKKVGQA